MYIMTVSTTVDDGIIGRHTNGIPTVLRPNKSFLPFGLFRQHFLFFGVLTALAVARVYLAANFSAASSD
jgi:hypothetical protein